MLKQVREQLTQIESELSGQEIREELYARMRPLGLSNFGELMFGLVGQDYPKLASMLPKMADDAVQVKWTGSSGMKSLMQSIDFIRDAAYSYSNITGRGLRTARVLDFGCGYGRLVRLMYYFISEKNLWGVDPWSKSIELCQAAGLDGNFFISDNLPKSLPVGDTRFDFIYAFSVFTHLSKRAAITALQTLETYLEDDGVILITIRPIEYWEAIHRNMTQQPVTDQIAAHEKEGFAFVPHAGPVVDGEITYGDTSMTLEWIEQQVPSLRVVQLDRSYTTPYQLVVYLKKR